MPKNKSKGLLFLMLLLFLFSACQAWEDRQTVARVNGEAIKKKPYRLIFQSRYQGMLQSHADLPPGMEQKLAQRILDEMINDALYFQEAKKRNLVLPMEEVTKSIGHMAAGKPDSSAFQKALKEKGITMGELKTEMQRRLAINALQGELTKEVTTTVKEAQEFYKKNRQLFYIPAEYRIGLLYAADVAGAESHQREMRTGKVKFEDLIAQNPPPRHQMAANQPIWVSAENFPGPMAQAIKETRVGKISPPVKGMEGYYLVKVYARKERRPQSFNQVKNDIIRDLNMGKRETILVNWLAEQKKKSVIEINQNRLKVKIESPAPAQGGKTSEPYLPKAGGGKG